MRQASILCAAAFATLEAASAESLSVSTSVGFESRYVFRGVQFAETSFQPAINLSYGNAYGGVWLNLPVGDDDLVVTPGGEELDFFGGYNISLNDAMTLDVGVTYYTFPDLASGFFDLYEEDGDGLGANTIEAYAGVSWSGPFSPSLYVFRDFNFDTFTVQGAASHSVDLAPKTKFIIGGTIGYIVDDDPGDYLYGTATADISYAISDNGTILAGVRYGGSDIAGGSIIDASIAGTFQSSGLWWGVGFAASF